MKDKAIVLVSSLASSGGYGELGTAAYKDAGNSAGNVPIIMSNGKLDSSILPPLQVTNVYTVDSEESMLELEANTGDICIRTDENKTYILTDTPASDLSNWTQISLIASSVESVNNKVGVVQLTATDVGAVESNESITGATKCKITYDSKGLVTAGADLTAADLPSHEHSAADITSGVLGVTYGGTGADTQAGARTNLDVYSKAETEALIPTDLSQLSNTTTNYVNSTELQEAISSMGNVFTLKGSVNDVADLPANNNELGDVYYVVNDEDTYVWMTDGTTYSWELLGATLDLSDCVKKSELLNSTGNETDNTMSQYAITQALNAKANVTDVPTQLNDLSGILPVSKGGTGTNSLSSGGFLVGNGTNSVSTLSVVPINKGGTNATSVSQARSNLNVYTKDTLYSNSNGTSGTITLSSSANNYKWIEIHYGWSNIVHSVNVIPNTSGNRTIDLQLSYTTSSANQLIVRSAFANLNGSTISFGRNKSTFFDIGGDSYTKNEYIVIYYVYGYKS